MKKQTPSSRAVLRPVEPGNNVTCAHCSEQVKFLTREQSSQVIANVYVSGKWDRVEHYHFDCYEQLAEPYGQPA